MDKKLQEMLNVYCANYGLGYIKVCNLHWNVKGKAFITAHKYLETQYMKWAELLDEVAEHLRINGVCPPATLKSYLQLATIEEKDSAEVEYSDAHKYLETQYMKWAELLDEVAEHLRINGVCPPATLKSYLQLATIEEKDSAEVEYSDAYNIWYHDMKLQRDLAVKIRKYADEIGADATVVMLDDEIAYFNKALWMLHMTISD